MRKPNLKIIVTTIALFAITFNSVGQLIATTYEKSKQSKQATFIYVYDGVAGFAEKKDDQVKGLIVDIMKDFETFLRDKKGISVSSSFVYKDDFSVFMKDVKGGKGGVFGLSNISISEARKSEFSFSPPYLDNVSLLLSNGKAATLSSLQGIANEFQGMTAYSLPASSYLKRLNEIKSNYFPNMQIVTVETEAEVLQNLANDEKAFAIMDVNYYLEVLQKKSNVKRHPVGDFKDDQFGILMPKNSDWEPLMREFFNSEFIESSRYSQMISDNLGGSALRLLNSLKTN